MGKVAVCLSPKGGFKSQGVWFRVSSGIWFGAQDLGPQDPGATW